MRTQATMKRQETIDTRLEGQSEGTPADGQKEESARGGNPALTC